MKETHFLPFRNLQFIISKMNVWSSAAAYSCTLCFLGQANLGVAMTVMPTAKHQNAQIPHTNARPTEVSLSDLLESATTPEHSPPRGIHWFCPPFPSWCCDWLLGQLWLSLWFLSQPTVPLPSALDCPALSNRRYCRSCWASAHSTELLYKY